jgi:hypothetical protein
VKHSGRYQSEPCTDDALRRWIFRLLYDYSKGVVDADQIEHRFNYLLGRRDKSMKPQIVRKLKGLMRQGIEGMQVLSKVLDQ